MRWSALKVRHVSSASPPIPRRESVLLVICTIPYSMLRNVLADLRRQPYHVAVGNAGLNILPSGDGEVLARPFELVHEGSLRSRQHGSAPRYELGFVPFTLDRPGVWEAVAFAARVEGD